MSTHHNSALADLIGRCLEGDNKAWKELLSIITPRILSVCSKYRLSQEESLDVYGQVCFMLLDDLEKLRTPQKLLSYVGQMAKHRAVNYHRELNQTVSLDETIERKLGMKTEPEAQEKLERTERMAELMEAMSELPPRQFQVLKMLLLDIDEPSYIEIAKRLEIPISSVGPTRSRAITRLKAILEKKKFKF